VPQGNYSVHVKFDLYNNDDDDFGYVNCKMFAGATEVDEVVITEMGPNDADKDGEMPGDWNVAMQTWLQNFNGTIKVDCTESGESDQVVANGAYLSAIKVDAVQ
jgi:hypothetical protein